MVDDLPTRVERTLREIVSIGEEVTEERTRNVARVITAHLLDLVARPDYYQASTDEDAARNVILTHLVAHYDLLVSKDANGQPGRGDLIIALEAAVVGYAEHVVAKAIMSSKINTEGAENVTSRMDTAVTTLRLALELCPLAPDHVLAARLVTVVETMLNMGFPTTNIDKHSRALNNEVSLVVTEASLASLLTALKNFLSAQTPPTIPAMDVSAATQRDLYRVRALINRETLARTLLRVYLYHVSRSNSDVLKLAMSLLHYRLPDAPNKDELVYKLIDDLARRPFTSLSSGAVGGVCTLMTLVREAARARDFIVRVGEWWEANAATLSLETIQPLMRDVTIMLAHLCGMPVDAPVFVLQGGVSLAIDIAARGVALGLTAAQMGADSISELLLACLRRAAYPVTVPLLRDPNARVILVAMWMRALEGKRVSIKACLLLRLLFDDSLEAYSQSNEYWDLFD